MKRNNTLKTLAFFSMLILCSSFNFSCSDVDKEAKTAEEAKAVMPNELKDTTVINKDEESALDKLNSITDTSSKK